MPFNPPAERIDENAFFEAGAMSDYLEEYVTSHVYNGQSLLNRILFRTSVEKLEKIGGIWHISCSSNGDALVLKAPKVIVSSGATSQPNLPDLKGSRLFKGKFIHSVNWADASFLADPTLKRITVIGGGKSAADMIYQCVKANKQVSWVIRKSGKGPGAFIPGHPIGWFKNPAELGVSRLGSYMFLSGLSRKGWWYWLLFNTRIGQAFYRKMGESGRKEAEKEADFQGRDGARESYKELDPKVE
jgi:hypothetical protein